jgi:predicted nucleotidyltransferase
MFSQDFKEFVELLNNHNVEYLIVGGYAVGIHGHPRYTGDLDIWLNPTLENAEKVLVCVGKFGFGSFNLTISDFIKPGNIVQLGYPPLRIDLLTEIDGVYFDECFKNKIIVLIEELQVNFISYNDLIKNKLKSGRHKDLDDIENLNEL